jgi:hypothetical protein
VKSSRRANKSATCAAEKTNAHPSVISVRIVVN